MFISLEEISKKFIEYNENLTRIERRFEYLINLVSSNFSPTNDYDDLLNVDQAAKFLDLAKPTIYEMSSKGVIPKMKRGKKLYFSRIDLVKFMHSHKIKTVEQIKAEADTCTVKLRK